VNHLAGNSSRRIGKNGFGNSGSEKVKAGRAGQIHPGNRRATQTAPDPIRIENSQASLSEYGPLVRDQ